MSKKKYTGKILLAGTALTGVFFLARKMAGIYTEDKSLNDDNPYIGFSPFLEEMTVYEKAVKPMIDKVLSFTGLLVLAPVFGIISLAVVFDDPGPVFFVQKRVGRNGSYFMLHKFRTMKTSTPHDVPTHELKNPDQYITRAGWVLRRTSLDELPQIWDIFRGKMSIIGPRPALWNQSDLVAEREKWNANSCLPGLTGLAQINGRDELKIPVKAKLDGDYVVSLRRNSLSGFCMDIRCFFGTIASVIKHDGVVEGGTGSLPDLGNDFQTKITRSEQFALRHGVPEQDPETDWSFKKRFRIDENQTMKVLITGAGSYIGQSFEAYAHEHYNRNFEIQTLNMRDESWKDFDFSGFDIVFHVAGIAHADISHVSDQEREQYYAVNTDLAIAAAKKAKASGVRQFIFMSSMIIYSGQVYIDEHTMPNPSNFYGDSKWQADRGIRTLESDSFHVAVLRPPMIYGHGSKGNYPRLSKLARKVPVFPIVENKRSMLYIENLLEFLCLLMLDGSGGIYVPQNAEYSNTSELVQMIGETTGKSVHLTRLLSPAVWLGSKVPGKAGRLVGKAFASSYYSQAISVYPGIDYQKYDLKTSIKITEGKQC